MKTLRLLILESYDGGSHGAFLDGFTEATRHRCERIGLPPRKWKWRMRGSGIYFAQRLAELNPDDYDVIFTSDMTPVADLRGLAPLPWRDKPVVCYFHENQLTYPLPDEDERDYQYGFTNITSALTADAVWFNSAYHRESFLAAVERLLRKMPDYVPERVAERIERRSKVMPLGLATDLFENRDVQKRELSELPIILWNHRWEYDKNPDVFFEALLDLQRGGEAFRVMVLGEQFRQSPPVFAAAEKVLRKRMVHFGFVPSRADYLEMLGRADIVVSTSIHEFFGLSVLEAIALGCRPLLPNRLSYPELIPAHLHGPFFYNNDRELRQRLVELLRGELPALPMELTDSVRALGWDKMAHRYDEALAEVAG